MTRSPDSRTAFMRDATPFESLQGQYLVAPPGSQRLPGIGDDGVEWRLRSLAQAAAVFGPGA